MLVGTKGVGEENIQDGRAKIVCRKVEYQQKEEEVELERKDTTQVGRTKTSRTIRVETKNTETGEKRCKLEGQ